MLPYRHFYLQDSRGPVTSSEKTGHEEPGFRNKRAIPLLAIAQGTAALGGMLMKGICFGRCKKSKLFQ